jgi:hypothetical protein
MHCVRTVYLCVLYDYHNNSINLLIFVVCKRTLLCDDELHFYMLFVEYKFHFYVTKIGIDIFTNNTFLSNLA